jgi:hypothetical protein
MMSVKASDGFSISQEAARFSGFGVAADVCFYGFVQAVQENLDWSFPIAALLGPANGISGKKIVMAGDVKMILPKIPGRDWNKSLRVA